MLNAPNPLLLANRTKSAVVVTFEPPLVDHNPGMKPGGVTVPVPVPATALFAILTAASVIAASVPGSRCTFADAVLFADPELNITFQLVI